MIVPFVLFVLALMGIAASRMPGYSDLLLIAVPSAAASLYLVLRAAARRRAKPPSRPNYIVIDGSNVLHWADNSPQIATVRAVVDRLSKLGFTPGVVFDANAGYKIAGSYMQENALGRILGLPADRVMVAPSGTPADPMLLTAARDLGARVVSNDRFRDWVALHPEVNEPGHLVRGGYRAGKLWLDLD